MAINRYSPELKAAVMAALLTGQSVGAIAAEYQIPEGTVKSWKSRDLRPNVPDATQKREIIGALILEYVEAALQALTAQLQVLSSEKYLVKQSASEIAVLHGVIADKAIRILEGIAANAPDDGGGTAEV